MTPNKTPFTIIRQSAQRIGQRMHPKKIILFGSYAYGKPNAESDVDLLVVFAQKKRTTQRYREVSKILEPRPFPMDILIRSTQEIRNRLNIGDFFIKEIMEKGKVLYES